VSAGTVGIAIRSRHRGTDVGRPAPGGTRGLTPLSIRVTTLALVLALVPLLWHAWSTLHGYFTQDDFVYTYQAAHTPLSLHYLFQSYGAGPHTAGPHIMPAQFLLIWVVTRIAPANYVVAVLPLLAMHAFAYWVLWRLLSLLFPNQSARLVPFAVFTLSPVLLITSMWWAFGLEIVPFALALFCAVLQHVRYLETGLRRHAVLALLATAGGLLFWEKAALIIPVLFAVSALLAPVKGVRARCMWAARKHAAAWVAFVVLAFLYGAMYLALATPTQAHTLRRGDVGRLGLNMLTHAFLPRLLGGPWSRNFGGAPLGAVVVLASLVAAALVVTALLRGGSRAVLAWLALVAYLGCDVALLATARLSFVGPVIGNDPRYMADAVPVAVILGSFAFMHPVLQWRRVLLPERSRFTPVQPGVAAIAVLLILGTMVSTALAVPAAQNREARRFATRISSELKRRPTMALFDGGVPRLAMLPVFGDEWRVSRVVGLLRPKARFDATGDAMFMAGSDGLTRPFEFFFAIPSVPGPVYNCGHLAGAGATDIPLARPVSQKHVVVRLDYFTGRSSTGTVRAGTRSIPVEFTTGGVRNLYAVTDGPLQSIAVSAGFPVCVVQALVGGPAPLPN
jgi:hypothetical protein